MCAIHFIHNVTWKIILCRIIVIVVNRKAKNVSLLYEEGGASKQVDWCTYRSRAKIIAMKHFGLKVVNMYANAKVLVYITSKR